MLKNLVKKVYLGRHAIMVAMLALAGLSLAACGKSSSGGGTTTGATTQAFGLAARAQDGAITLSWPRISDAKKYNLYWSLTSGVTKSTGTKIADVAAPYQHTGLSNGTPVYYVFTVETSVGEGAESLEISLAPSATASGAPDYVDARGQDGRVELFWGGVADATEYKVYRKTARGETFGNAISVDATSPTAFTGLQNGQSYYFAVTAVVNGVESAPSSETVALPYAPEMFALTSGDPPKTPRRVYAFAGHEQVTIDADDQGDALRYTIYWNTSGNVAATDAYISDVVLPYTHTGLVDGTPYYYSVAAQNQHGGSALSPEISNVPNNDTIATWVTSVADPVLRTCITASATAYGWKYQRQLREVDCENQSATDLTGLEKFSNLSFLYLSQPINAPATVTNVNALEKLANLYALGLSREGIVDLSFLLGLKNLAWLDMSNNQITNLGSLAALVNLEELYLDNNAFSDLTPLAGLSNLVRLWVGHDLDDPDPVRILTLEPLRNLTALTDLHFENNAISDTGTGLSPLAKLANLQTLVFTKNQVSSLLALKDLTQLRTLYAGYNQITDIHLVDIKGLTNLEFLVLESNQAMGNISDLAPLAELRVLYLGGNKIVDVAPLAGMSKLTRLYLWGNQIVDVSPLASLTSLEILNLASNKIGPVGVGRVDTLKDLTKAQYIGLGGNGATISCVELGVLVNGPFGVGGLGSPPVDLDGDETTSDTPMPGVNCTN